MKKKNNDENFVAFEDTRFDPDLRSKDFQIDEMSFTKVQIGNHHALKVNSNLVRHRVLEQIVMCIDPEHEPLDHSNCLIGMDVLINCLIDTIRAHTSIQDTHLMYCMRWYNVYPYTFVLEKATGTLHLVWIRFHPKIYDHGTLFEGYYVIDKLFYPHKSWTIEHFSLPDTPVGALEETKNCEESEESEGCEGCEDCEDCEDCGSEEDSSHSSLAKDTKKLQRDNTIFDETTVSGSEKVTELISPDDFIKARMPRQGQKTTECRFYVRRVWKMCGEPCGEPEKTYDVTLKFNLEMDKYHQEDPVFSNVKLVPWFNQVYAYECDNDKSHPNTILYKPIPFNLLHGHLVEQRLKSAPHLHKRIDWKKRANMVIQYYGPDKPGVYNLCVKSNSSASKVELEVYDTAYIPNLEGQQYIICLLRKMQKSDHVIVRCVFEKIKRKWIPLHHLKKSDTQIASRKSIQSITDSENVK